MACIETFALGTWIYEMLKQGFDPAKIPEILRRKGIRLATAQLHILGEWGLSRSFSYFTSSLLAKTMDGLFRLVEEPDAKQVAKKEKIATKYYEKPDSIEEISQLLALCQQNLCKKLIVLREDLKRPALIRELERKGINLEFYTKKTIKKLFS